MTEEQLAALLHLKRYEQAPPEYFDCLLEDIHRRQRADLLQLPLWKIAVDRALTFFGERDTGRVSPAGALVTAIVIAMAVTGLIPHTRELPRKNAATPPPGGAEPRYVIDSPPVSHERPSSISF
jgi:hypothetical protein